MCCTQDLHGRVLVGAFVASKGHGADSGAQDVASALVSRRVRKSRWGWSEEMPTVATGDRDSVRRGSSIKSSAQRVAHQSQRRLRQHVNRIE